MNPINELAALRIQVALNMTSTIEGRARVRPFKPVVQWRHKKHTRNCLCGWLASAQKITKKQLLGKPEVSLHLETP